MVGPAIDALTSAGITHRVVRHGPVRSVAEAAKAATGYERGTITPFGSTTRWPVIADQRLSGRLITLGAVPGWWPPCSASRSAT